MAICKQPKDPTQSFAISLMHQFELSTCSKAFVREQDEVRRGEGVQK